MEYRLGLDIGSTTSKVVLLDEDGVCHFRQIQPTGLDGRETATSLWKEALANWHEESPRGRIVATGYGRCRVPFAHQILSEITCHARGAFAERPDIRTVIDIGGQDAKVIRLGPGGRVEDFAMNDRCAAGTGSFFDAIVRRFGLSFERLSTLYEQRPKPLDISSTCVVFAESEIVGLLAEGHAMEEILAGVHRAVAQRIVALVRQARGIPPFLLSGGVALNETLRQELSALLEAPVDQASYPQFTAAYGAALLAGE